MIRVRQKDGTTRTFLADDFWMQLFLSEARAAVGERTPTAVSLALEAATPEGLAEIRALIRNDGGTFLQAAPVDGLGIVGERPTDLSETF